MASMSSLRTTLIALAVATATGLTSPAQTGTLQARWSITPGFPVAVTKLVDLDGDGRQELVLIGRDGEVRHWRPGDKASSGGAGVGKTLRGQLDLPDPAYSLVALTALTPAGRPKLIVLGPTGVIAYDLVAGVFGGQGHQLLGGRVRFTLRTGQPQAAEFVTDVNGDQRADLVIPGMSHCSLYVNRPSDDPIGARFTLVSRIENEIQASASTGSEALSSNLSVHIEIPNLRTSDVNGDGRADLIAKEDGRVGYHLQHSDGSFPEQPSVVLDLSLFRDTTPKAEFRFGQTVAMDEATMRTRDLTADGIPDYVILHRRKVWVFHATEAGPQFTRPAKILKTTEDISFATLVNLDDDKRPDLLLFRLEAPSIATLLAGLVMQWDIKVEGIGYRNQVEGAFARRPTWRSTITLRAPAILRLLSRMDGIVEKFKKASKKFRHAVEADLDGNQKPDILMQTEDRKALEFWMDTEGIASPAGTTERQIQRFVFEDENRVWDLDRILELMHHQAASREARLTKGSPASGSLVLRDPEKFRLVFAAAADLDGDGSQEVVLRYREVNSPSKSVFDVLALSK